MNWNNQAALTELFTRSFAPLAQLSAGRLALLQAGVERDQAERAAASRAAQQLAAQQTLLRQQAGMQQEQQWRAHELALALEGLRSQNELERARLNFDRQLAVGKQNADLNAQTNLDAHNRARLERALELRQKLGMVELDPAAYGPEESERLIDDIQFFAAHKSAEQQEYANKLATEANAAEVEAQIELNNALRKSQLSEKEFLTLAKPRLQALAGKNEKLKAQIKGLGSAADVAEFVSQFGEDGAMVYDQIQKSAEAQQKIKSATYAREVQSAQQRLQLATKMLGAVPREARIDFDAVNARRADALFSPRSGSSEPPPPPELPGDGGETKTTGKQASSTSWLGPTLATGGLAASGATALKGTGTLAALKRMAGLAIPKLARPANLNPALAVASGLELANELPTAWGSDPLTTQGAMALAGSFDDELAKQNAYRARAAQLAATLHGLGQVDAARRVRAQGAAPTLDFRALEQAAGMAPPVPMRMPNFGW